MLPVVFQWSSSGSPVVSQCVPIMQITTGSPLGHHWVLASASVVPMASQCTSGSNGLAVCSNYANEHWVATGTPLGASISQCGSSGIPVYLWLQWSSRPLMYTSGMVRVVWAKLISFDLQPQIHKNYNGAHIKGMYRVMLKYSHVLRAELTSIAEQ